MQASGLRPAFSRAATSSALAAALFIPSIVSAAGPSPSNWGLGLAGISTQKAYKAMERDNLGFPLIYFENDWLQVFGPVIELKLPTYDLSATNTLNFRLLVKYDGSGYAPKDSPFLIGMDERKGGFWAGAKVKWDNPVVDLQFEISADASGKSKGKRFSLGLERTWRLGSQFMLTPRLNASWLSKEYVDYYYGVRQTEALATRPVYVGAKAASTIELGVRGTYTVGGPHSLFLDIAATTLPERISNSPLVERGNENRVALGYMYRF